MLHDEKFINDVDITHELTKSKKYKLRSNGKTRF